MPGLIKLKQTNWNYWIKPWSNSTWLAIGPRTLSTDLVFEQASIFSIFSSEKQVTRKLDKKNPKNRSRLSPETFLNLVCASGGRWVLPPVGRRGNYRCKQGAFDLDLGCVGGEFFPFFLVTLRILRGWFSVLNKRMVDLWLVGVLRKRKVGLWLVGEYEKSLLIYSSQTRVLSNDPCSSSHWLNKRQVYLLDKYWCWKFLVYCLWQLI